MIADGQERTQATWVPLPSRMTRFRFHVGELRSPHATVRRYRSIRRWLKAPDFGLRLVHPSGINSSAGEPNSSGNIETSPDCRLLSSCAPIFQSDDAVATTAQAPRWNPSAFDRIQNTAYARRASLRGPSAPLALFCQNERVYCRSPFRVGLAKESTMLERLTGNSRSSEITCAVMQTH